MRRRRCASGGGSVDRIEAIFKIVWTTLSCSILQYIYKEPTQINGPQIGRRDWGQGAMRSSLRPASAWAATRSRIISFPLWALTIDDGTDSLVVASLSPLENKETIGRRDVCSPRVSRRPASDHFVQIFLSRHHRWSRNNYKYPNHESLVDYVARSVFHTGAIHLECPRRLFGQSQRLETQNYTQRVHTKQKFFWQPDVNIGHHSSDTGFLIISVCGIQHISSIYLFFPRV